MNTRAWTAIVLVLGLIATAGAAYARYGDGWGRSIRPIRLVPAVVEVQRPVLEPRAAERGFVGVVLASENVEVAVRSSGRVQEVAVRLGSRVARGDRIALLDTRALRRELAVAATQLESMSLEVDKKSLELREAKQRFERRQAGAQLEVPTVSLEELNTAEFRGQQAALDQRLAHAHVSEQQARIALLRQQLDDSELRAPFDGVVSARYVDPGAIVSPDAPIVRLLGDGHVRLRFGVPERAAQQFAAGARASVEIEGTPGVLEAVVEQSAPEVDTAARLVFVEAQLVVPPHTGSTVLAGRIARVFSASGPVALAAPRDVSPATFR